MPDDYERKLLGNEFSDIIKFHNQALERLDRFKEEYPYLIHPSIFETIEANLKDNVQILYRELQNIHRSNGPHYEEKYVCKRCQQTFMISLPGGLCDKCRAETQKE